MAPVIANPDQQVWAMILKNFAHIIPQDTSIKNNEKGYVIMNKIVVIGGGTMGLDIAQVFAKKGMDVVVRDIKDEILDASTRVWTSWCPRARWTRPVRLLCWARSPSPPT